MFLLKKQELKQEFIDKVKENIEAYKHNNPIEKFQFISIKTENNQQSYKF